jgi:hypothetical protein
MTTGNVALTAQRAPRISPVSGVPMAGETFMKTVFQLEPGQVGVAFNAPQTVVYVIRPSEFTSYETRWRLFVHNDFGEYAAAGAAEQQQIGQAWLEEIKKSAGFEWGPGHKAVDETAERQPTPTQHDLPMDDEE